MDIANAQGTPMMAAIIVFAAVGFLALIGVVFKGNVHF